MARDMKLLDVAMYLGKGPDMVKRYRNDGLLTAEKRGKELFFDRDEVVAFAKSRGIRTLESGVPEGSNFTLSPQSIREIAEQVALILKRDRELVAG